MWTIWLICLYSLTVLGQLSKKIQNYVYMETERPTFMVVQVGVVMGKTWVWNVLCTLCSWRMANREQKNFTFYHSAVFTSLHTGVTYTYLWTKLRVYVFVLKRTAVFHLYVCWRSKSKFCIQVFSWVSFMFKSATWLQFYNRVKTPHKIVVGAIKKSSVLKGAICCAALPHNFTRRRLVRPGCRGRDATSSFRWNPPPPLCTIIYGSTLKKCAVRFVPNPLSFLFIKVMLSRKASVWPLEYRQCSCCTAREERLLSFITLPLL
jgi:hypothetical protein